MSILLELRSLHGEQSWQDVDEDSPNPRSHGVGLWGAEVHIENHHRDTYTEGVEDHGEQHKLAEEGDDEGGRGDDLGEQEEEHSEGEEDGDWEGDLLPTVGGQVEHQDCQEGDAHAGDDQVHGVEQCFPSHGDVEGDIKVGLITAGVVLDISYGRHLKDVPLDRRIKLR